MLEDLTKQVQKFQHQDLEGMPPLYRFDKVEKGGTDNQSKSIGLTTVVTEADLSVELDVLAIGAQQAILVDGYLLVERLYHSPKLSHIKDIGLPAMEPHEVLALELGPAGLHYVERRTYNSNLEMYI